TSTSSGTGGSGGTGGAGGGTGGDPQSYTERCNDEPTVWVAKDGADGASCGGSSDPCLTIKHALGLATSGDAVCVRQGTYDESWVEVPSGVRLISADGDQAAAIYSGTESAVRFTDQVTGASLEGFEVYGDWDQGSAGDGLIRVHDASDILVYRVVAHDAPYDQDVVKVSGQVTGLVLDGIVAYNPAHRTGGNFQENIDIFGSGAQGNDPPPVSGVIVRNCWLFHTQLGGDFLIYSKIYTERVVYENNVFGPSGGGGWGNVAVGMGTGEVGIPNSSAPVIVDAIVRNNIFVGLKGDAALGVFNSENVWIYNNTFYGNTGPDLRSVIMFRGNSHQVGPTYLIDNVFLDNQPSQSGAAFFWVRENGLPTTWEHHHNLYDGNIATTDTPYTGETDSVYDTDPALTSPAVPVTDNPSLQRVVEIKADYALTNGSPALGVGIDVVGETGHPNWEPGATDRRWDYEGDARDSGGAWDLGADER
ncbi:MAG: hypothetical protein DRI90_17735, partial [Deltaproteobacteria bacterium]